MMKTRHLNKLRAGAPARQGGAILIVVLILLMVLGLSAVWAHNGSSANLRIMSNTQARQEALSAAQSSLERVISTTLFSSAPDTVAATPLMVDVDGDGQSDYTAQVSPAPSCYRVKSIKNSDLDPDTESDRSCMGSGTAQNAGIEGLSGTTSGDSLCTDSEWNVRVTVSDPRSKAFVAVNQGIKIRGPKTDAASACP